MKKDTYDAATDAAIGLSTAVVSPSVISATPRGIPNPPGGGSWTWDETSWTWKSNDPVVNPAVITEE